MIVVTIDAGKGGNFVTLVFLMRAHETNHLFRICPLMMIFFFFIVASSAAPPFIAATGQNLGTIIINISAMT